jgi:hypothetical protein
MRPHANTSETAHARSQIAFEDVEIDRQERRVQLVDPKSFHSLLTGRTRP